MTPTDKMCENESTSNTFEKEFAIATSSHKSFVEKQRNALDKKHRDTQIEKERECVYFKVDNSWHSIKQVHYMMRNG